MDIDTLLEKLKVINKRTYTNHSIRLWSDGGCALYSGLGDAHFVEFDSINDCDKYIDDLFVQMDEILER